MNAYAKVITMAIYIKYMVINTVLQYKLYVGEGKEML
jgi:hypothetical protein